jgi:FixJ family two-component response regulator
MEKSRLVLEKVVAQLYLSGCRPGIFDVKNSSNDHVYVIDDNKAVRESLCWLIESVDLSAHGFRKAEDFLNLPELEDICCVVTDVRMPGISGLELLGLLKAKEWIVPVIVITAHGDIQMAVEAMKLGARDFLEKPFENEALLDAVDRALAFHKKRLFKLTTDEVIKLRMSSFTPRETEVLKLIVSGSSNRSVADELGISEKTVEAHRAHIMEKTGAQSFAELLRLAFHVQSHEEE